MTLQPVSRQGERRTVALTGSSDNLSFSFDDVLPGKYKGAQSMFLLLLFGVGFSCSTLSAGNLLYPFVLLVLKREEKTHVFSLFSDSFCL